jgi:hypothetical protein
VLGVLVAVLAGEKIPCQPEVVTSSKNAFNVEKKPKKLNIHFHLGFKF